MGSDPSIQSGRASACLVATQQFNSSNRRICDPYALWCGGNGAVRRRLIPIKCHKESI